MAMVIDPQISAVNSSIRKTRIHNFLLHEDVNRENFTMGKWDGDGNRFPFSRKPVKPIHDDVLVY
jgi:hypothetical protein